MYNAGNVKGQSNKISIFDQISFVIFLSILIADVKK